MILLGAARALLDWADERPWVTVAIIAAAVLIVGLVDDPADYRLGW